MIMDGLESMSAMSFAEAHTHFQHLLNFDAFKTELPGGIQQQVQDPESGIPPDTIIDDSLNTPISSFMDLPVFFSGPTPIPIAASAAVPAAAATAATATAAATATGASASAGSTAASTATATTNNNNINNNIINNNTASHNNNNGKRQLLKPVVVAVG